ncbi:hypothetical protein HK405_014886, partial [Cladochytrium tenue]
APQSSGFYCTMPAGPHVAVPGGATANSPSPGQRFFDSLRISFRKAERVSIRHRRAVWRARRRLAYDRLLWARRRHPAGCDGVGSDDSDIGEDETMVGKEAPRTPVGGGAVAGGAAPIFWPVVASWSPLSTRTSTPSLASTGSFSPTEPTLCELEYLGGESDDNEDDSGTTVPVYSEFVEAKSGPRQPSLNGLRGCGRESQGSAAHFAADLRSLKRDAVRTLERRKSQLQCGAATSGGVRRRRCERIREFLRHGLWRHDQRVWMNRGFSLDAARGRGGRWNLGMMLNIKESYDEALDIDCDQGTARPQTEFARAANGASVYIVTIPNEAAATGSAFSSIFDAAESLVRSQFAKKNVSADLDGVLDDGFSVDVAVDAVTGAVLGAVEYVFMRRFLWVDAIAVKEEFQGAGVGSLLIQRLAIFHCNLLWRRLGWEVRVGPGSGTRERGVG